MQGGAQLPSGVYHPISPELLVGMHSAEAHTSEHGGVLVGVLYPGVCGKELPEAILSRRWGRTRQTRDLPSSEDREKCVLGSAKACLPTNIMPDCFQHQFSGTERKLPSARTWDVP